MREGRVLDKGRVKIVVILPVKNESWILGEFLTAASEYADHIIVGDHHSTDDSGLIVSKFPKAILVTAKTKEFSERERREQLLAEARKFGGNNLIISLDADEFLSPDAVTSGLLQNLKNLEPGTHIRFPFFNALPGFEKGWIATIDPVAFIDDGARHPDGLKIHFPRLPRSDTSKILDLEWPNAVIHLQYLDWARMESKHRWYQAWERINFPGKSPLAIFRRYHHMYSMPSKRMVNIPSNWDLSFKEANIDFAAATLASTKYWWDQEVSVLVESHGANFFRYTEVGLKERLPTISERLFFAYSQSTQKYANLSKWSPLRLTIKLIDISLQYFWR